MRDLISIIMLLGLASCGGSNSSGKGKSGMIVRNPLGSAPECQGPARMNTLVGSWSDWTQNAEDEISLTFNTSNQVEISLGCKNSDDTFSYASTNTTFLASQTDVSIASHDLVEVRTDQGGGCSLENLQGTYSYRFQGNCLVLSSGNEELYLAPFEANTVSTQR